MLSLEWVISVFSNSWELQSARMTKSRRVPNPSARQNLFIVTFYLRFVNQTVGPARRAKHRGAPSPLSFKVNFCIRSLSRCIETQN